VNKKEVTILSERVEREFLPFVRRPSRYIGGEINQIKKEASQCSLTVALCFPDVYEVAMSYSGLMIVYDVINKMEGVAAERVFAPWIDAEKILREKKIALFSLESKAPLKSFDIVGFSLTNELCYSNVLNMLDLGGLNVRSSNRSENEPLVIAGGGQTNCCEPLAEFVDLFVLGEGEETVVKLVELVKGQKQGGPVRNSRTGNFQKRGKISNGSGATKREILFAAAQKFDWAYVPCLYEFEYDGAKIKSFQSIMPELRRGFKNAVVEDFENAAAPLRPIVPFTKAVHERVSVEIMRGCPGRCRFCKASFCRRPIRCRSVERIIDIAKACYEATGFDTVSLLSLSTADYPKLEELVGGLQAYFRDKYVGLSLPSLRVEQSAIAGLAESLSSVRKSGLTIAIESASEKLRQIINKPLKDEDLFAAAEAAYRAGWQRLKLYFMVGLPGESEEDVKQIVHLSFQLAKVRKKVDGKTGQINITISWLVPKAHTPFGWLGQKPKSYFEQAKKIILDEKRKLRARFLQFKFHNIELSVLESAMGRGDRRLCDVIETAWRNGARFDLWAECFDYTLWQKAFEKFGMDVEKLAEREFGRDEVLPWEHLGGPEKDYLLGHLDKAQLVSG